MYMYTQSDQHHQYSVAYIYRDFLLRIQSGDLLVEISNRSMLGASIDEAIHLLKEQKESIRLKIARPDLSRASVYVVEGDKEVS